MTTVGVLITNYQTWPLTERAIDEVLRWSGNQVTKIVVVDDASVTPATTAHRAKVVIHRNATNLGYVRSVNVGMRLLTEDVVLVFDSDAYPSMDLVPEVVRRFEAEPQLGALGFFEINAEGKTRIAGDNEPTLGFFLLGQALGSRCAQNGWFIGQRYVVHSCCMAVRRNALDQIGGFDEEFDFLDADTDFSMRLQDAGWQIKTDEDLKCFHQGSGSPQMTSKRVARFHRNRWLLLRKHGKVRFPTLCRFVLKLRHLCEWLLLSLAMLFRLGPTAQLQEKICGRRQLMRSVFRDYSID